MAIDEPLDQIEQQNRLETTSVPDLVISVVGALVPFVGVAAVLRQHFNTEAARSRVVALFEGVRDEYRQLSLRVDSLEEAISSPAAADAVIAAATEVVQTNSPTRVKRIAKVLAGEAAGARNWSEAESFVRDLGRLTDHDVAVLQTLAAVQAPLAVSGSMPTDPNVYTGHFEQLCEAMDQSGMPREEFYSLCARLVGFGLAATVERNIAIVSLRDQCFRLTSRGLRLSSLLGRHVPKT